MIEEVWRKIELALKVLTEANVTEKKYMAVLNYYNNLILADWKEIDWEAEDGESARTLFWSVKRGDFTFFGDILEARQTLAAILQNGGKWRKALDENFTFEKA